MFDKIKFSKILSDINSTYNTMTEFSQKSGVNRTYLSQYINMKLDSPPTPKILSKIAEASNKVVTYEDLMLVCGYINKNMEFSEITKRIFNKYLPALKELNLNAELLDVLYKTSFEPANYSKKLETLLSELSKETQDKVYIIKSNILKEVNEMMENSINNIKILTKYNFENILDNGNKEFKFAYHKEMEGLTDEEIADALRFYKEMKNKMKGNK